MNSCANFTHGYPVKSIPSGNLLTGIGVVQYTMDKYEARRTALQALISSFGKGGIAHVAAKIDKSASYVSRMLYPENKPGKKRIGEDSVDLLNAAFPGWLDTPPTDTSPVLTSNVRLLPVQQDSITQEVIAMMAATDDKGKAMVLAAAKIALHGYQPAKANLVS